MSTFLVDLVYYSVELAMYLLKFTSNGNLYALSVFRDSQRGFITND